MQPPNTNQLDLEPARDQLKNDPECITVWNGRKVAKVSIIGMSYVGAIYFTFMAGKTYGHEERTISEVALTLGLFFTLVNSVFTHVKSIQEAFIGKTQSQHDKFFELKSVVTNS